jgi:hypothetical protein
MRKMLLKIKIHIVQFLLNTKPIKREINSIKFFLKQSHTSEIEQLKQSHTSEIEQLKQSHTSEIEQLNAGSASKQNDLLRILYPTFDTQISYLKKKSNDDLDNLCEKYGTDKGYTKLENHPYSWIPHNYSIYYSKIFLENRFRNINIFECGIGTNNPNLPSNMTQNGNPGASLRVWKDYFPNANIYGADVDENILFSEDRIKTAYLDQLNPESIERYFHDLGEIQFEIMIDDGMHNFESSINLFDKSINYLSSSGVYIIEDVFPENFGHFLQYFNEFEGKYNVEFIVLENYDRKSIHDNALITISKNIISARN